MTFGTCIVIFIVPILTGSTCDRSCTTSWRCTCGAVSHPRISICSLDIMTEYALITRGHLLCPILEYVLVICITSSAQSILGCCAYLVARILSYLVAPAHEEESHTITITPTPHIALSLSLYSIHYLSHAFPLQMNHQQRNPTRPPTTTTTATAMPAMAPVLRPLLLTLPPVLSSPPLVPSVLT
eukprot:XP_001704455.1 Hypothetical protein GL50803_31657 [Giardia lamblia ATCC 50803]